MFDFPTAFLGIVTVEGVKVDKATQSVETAKVVIMAE